MASFNRVILMGNLTRDPELKTVGPTGTKVARLIIAMNERRRDRNGEIKDYPIYVDIDAWDKLATLCGQYLSKGRSILVEGRIQMDTWEKDGRKHQKLKVRASNIKFLAQGDRLNGGPSRQLQQPAPDEAVPPEASLESDPDDIPF